MSWLARIAFLSVGLFAASCSGSKASKMTRDGPGPDGGGDAGTGDELPSDALGGFRSGSRLQARYLHAEGAPDVFLEAYDTVLDQHCSFDPAEDGKLRCLPRLLVRRGSGTDLHPNAEPAGYLDTKCKEPVYDAGPDCPGRRRFIQEPSVCEDRVLIREVVQVTDDTPLYVRMGVDTCEASADRTVHGMYRRGKELPPSEMVAAKEAKLPIDGPLTRIVYVGEDGSWILGDIWITDMATTCRARYMDDAEACVLNTKTYGEWGEYYSDAACKSSLELAFTYVATECPVPPYLVDGRRTHGRVEQAFAKDEQGGCVPAEEVGDLIEISAEEPPALPETQGKLLGTGRLKARVVHSASGVPLRAAADDQSETLYWDATLNSECEPIENGDGELRCVPGTIDYTIQEYTSRGEELRFSDARCSEAVDYCDTGACEETVNYVKAADSTCGRLDSDIMWTWKERHEGTTYGFDELGACVETTDDRMLWRRTPLAWKDLPLIERLH